MKIIKASVKAKGVNITYFNKTPKELIEELNELFPSLPVNTDIKLFEETSEKYTSAVGHTLAAINNESITRKGFPTIRVLNEFDDETPPYEYRAIIRIKGY